MHVKFTKEEKLEFAQCEVGAMNLGGKRRTATLSFIQAGHKLGEVAIPREYLPSFFALGDEFELVLTKKVTNVEPISL